MNFNEFLDGFNASSNTASITALSNFQIIKICKKLKIKNFRGVFMRDNLPRSPTDDESMIINIDDSTGPGTHWVCLFIRDGSCIYFDSYGLGVPTEVAQYCTNSERHYSTFPIQTLGSNLCGHYCIYVLYKLDKGVAFDKILDELYKSNHT
jgi:hypothetical protein